MKRKAMLAAALGLLVVGCQSEFDRCMEVGTAIQREYVRLGIDKDSEFETNLAKQHVWERCAGRREVTK